MITIEQVEKLRERTGITYEEAKKVLQETNGDMLDAMIRLEQQQRIQAPAAGGYYHSKGEQPKTEQAESKQKATNDTSGASSFGENMDSFFNWCGKLLHKGNVNSLRVVKGNTNIMVLPLTVFALLLLFAFWVVIPVAILGLVFGYRYYFSGPDLDETKVNRAMDTVSDATMRAVDSVVEATANRKKDDTQNKGEKANGENPPN